MKTKQAKKTTKCKKCQQEFLQYQKIDGVWLSFNHRSLCLTCSPLENPWKRTNLCKQCGMPFRQYDKNNINPKTGKPINLSRRAFCLECSPFGEYRKNKKPIIDGKRECSVCKQFKTLSEFQKYRNGLLCGACRPCDNKRRLEYGRGLKAKAVDYLGGKCCICGYNRCMRSLAFHHKDPSQKEFSIGHRKLLNWDDTRKELDKCALLCNNCHGELHDGLISLPK